MPGKLAAPIFSIALSRAAQADIEAILEWTMREFAATGRKRYEALIQAALVDLLANPSRIGVRQRDDIAPGVFTYYLWSSRKRSKTVTRVGKPRHIVFFSIKGKVIQVLRVLHDSMDFTRHVPSPH
jgi:toxin ParE1/3/4